MSAVAVRDRGYNLMVAALLVNELAHLLDGLL